MRTEKGNLVSGPPFLIATDSSIPNPVSVKCAILDRSRALIRRDANLYKQSRVGHQLPHTTRIVSSDRECTEFCFFVRLFY